MRALVFTALVLATGQTAAQADGYAGIAADAASTAVSLNAVPGAVEVNPLGWWTVPIRMGVVAHAKTLPPEEGKPLIDAVDSTGWGAAAANLLMLTGAGLPLRLVIGGVVTAAKWQGGGEEREFWRICAAQRRDNPQLTCTYTKR